MAGETLRTATELLLDYADNVTEDITALTGRNLVVSAVTGVAFLEDDPAQVPYIIPMTDGVPVEFLGTLVAPLFVGNFWELQPVTNKIVPAYGTLGITVPPATTRLNAGSVILNCQKVGGGTADYEFQGLEGGQLTGNPVTRTIPVTPTTLVFAGDRLYDVAVGAGVDFQITPLGTSDDLQINDVRVTLESILI